MTPEEERTRARISMRERRARERGLAGPTLHPQDFRNFLAAWRHPRFPKRTDGRPDWWSVLEWDAKRIPIPGVPKKEGWRAKSA